MDRTDFDPAMDFALDYLLSQIHRKKQLGPVDVFLEELDPNELPAEVIVVVLIATLPVAKQLKNRASFIERSKGVLSREPEGLDAVLMGLE